MNAKHTWAWFLTAALLFAFIFLFERHWRQPAPGPERVLPDFHAADVATIQVYPAGESEIRAERTNGGWTLTKPIAYPAQASRIETLLAALERLTPAAPPLTARELRQHPRAEAEYGLENPQATLVLDSSRHLRFGRLTAPGDQVFLRVVGAEGVYVVDAGLLRLLPRATNDWRDTAFVDLRSLTFDRLLVTNAARGIEFQRDATHDTWRLMYPLKTRADTARLSSALQQLQQLQVAQFVSDDARPDLESFGLQPAELELVFARGTDPVARLSFGRTNAAGQTFARRQGVPGVVAVNGAPLALWRVPINDFRDRHLLTLPRTPGPVAVRGADSFTLLPQSNGWRLRPADFPVDQALADDLLATLAQAEIEFYKDAVTEPDLRTNGLVSPAREITLMRPAAADGTNAVLAQLAFGVTNDHKVLVARADEDSIYALPLAVVQRLPWAGWQLRERRLWRFSENDVARLISREAGRTREVLRLGTNSWTLAPNSQGIINPFAIEETTHRFGELAATLWVERGAQELTRYGITTNSLALTFELKNGASHTVRFGASAPSQYPYAAVTLDQETWVFEFPLGLYAYVSDYLRPTSNTP
jgi:hypothetical protein